MQPLRHLELPGFEPVDEDALLSEDGVVVRPVYIELVPDLVHPLADLPALRRSRAVAAAEQGCLIEADVVPLGGQPALRQIVKVPAPGRDHGQAFLGSFIVPKAACSVVLLVQAMEQGTTGIREALIMGGIGTEDYFRPHPYAPELRGALPFHVADDPAYDTQFPYHPLSRVRQVMAQLAAQVTLDPAFAALPPFAPRRGWLSRLTGR